MQISNNTDRPVALVTGGNKGLGRQVVLGLAERGWDVWLGARDLDSAAATLEVGSSLPGRISAVQLDVTNTESIQSAAREVHQKHGRLDSLVNNAGVFLEMTESGPVLPEHLSLETLRTTYETNLLGPLAMIQAFLPLMRKSSRPRIVNVSSGLGSLFQNADPFWEYAGFNVLAYNSSKSALNAVTVTFAKSLRAEGVLVNSADPGYCATDLNGHSGVRTAAQGAAIILRLATLGEDGPTGGFFCDSGSVPW